MTTQTEYGILHPDRPNRGPTTGGDIIRLYIHDLENRNALAQVTDQHLYNYRNSLIANPNSRGNRYVAFMEVIGERKLPLLVQNDLSAWLQRNPQWKSAETRRRNLAAALACFRWALEEGFVSRTPYLKTRRLQEPRVFRRDATDEETIRIWAAASEELRNLLWFIDQTGARTCEARNLLWTDIRWEERVAVIADHKTRRMQKEPTPRVIGLDAVIGDLNAWFVLRTTHLPFVFVTRRGKPWTKDVLADQFARLRQRCGLPDDLTPYCFRHRFGTLGIVAGMTEREVGDLMGHTDSNTTRRYTHTITMKIIGGKSAKMTAARPVLRPPLQLTYTKKTDERTVNDVLAWFRVHDPKRERTDSPEQRRRQHVRDLFGKACGEMFIENCRPRDLADFIEGQAKLVSRWSKRRWLAILVRPFSYAVQQGFISRQPFDGLDYEPPGPGDSADDQADEPTAIETAEVG